MSKRSFAALRMTTKRNRVIQSGAKDLYAEPHIKYSLFNLPYEILYSTRKTPSVTLREPAPSPREPFGLEWLQLYASRMRLRATQVWKKKGGSWEKGNLFKGFPFASERMDIRIKAKVYRRGPHPPRCARHLPNRGRLLWNVKLIRAGKPVEEYKTPSPTGGGVMNGWLRGCAGRRRGRFWTGSFRPSS